MCECEIPCELRNNMSHSRSRIPHLEVDILYRNCLVVSYPVWTTPYSYKIHSTIVPQYHRRFQDQFPWKTQCQGSVRRRQNPENVLPREMRRSFTAASKYEPPAPLLYFTWKPTSIYIVHSFRHRCIEQLILNCQFNYSQQRINSSVGNEPWLCVFHILIMSLLNNDLHRYRILWIMATWPRKERKTIQVDKWRHPYVEGRNESEYVSVLNQEIGRYQPVAPEAGLERYQRGRNRRSLFRLDCSQTFHF